VQLRQVVLNLVLNAAEATAGAGGAAGVTLRLSSCPCDASTLAGSVLHDELPPGRYVVLEVVDQGPGMDDATRSRMFEPFFSTKFPGRGLGLAAVLGIVRSHRGTLDVDSGPGRGTTVRVFLPAHDPSAPPHARPAGAEAWRGTGAALVVDDEPAVRGLAAVMLERMGFEVTTAQDGAQALDLLCGAASDARLVLLDVTMPRLDGIQTLHAVRTLRPGLPVVLSSGYHDGATLLQGEAPADAFVKKPYRFDELRDVVRGLLGA
jgi:CheY-like chemotaxis protein